MEANDALTFKVGKRYGLKTKSGVEVVGVVRMAAPDRVWLYSEDGIHVIATGRIRVVHNNPPAR